MLKSWTLPALCLNLYGCWNTHQNQLRKSLIQKKEELRMKGGESKDYFKIYLRTQFYPPWFRGFLVSFRSLHLPFFVSHLNAISRVQTATPKLKGDLFHSLQLASRQVLFRMESLVNWSFSLKTRIWRFFFSNLHLFGSWENTERIPEECFGLHLNFTFLRFLVPQWMRWQNFSCERMNIKEA